MRTYWYGVLWEDDHRADIHCINSHFYFSSPTHKIFGKENYFEIR